MLPSHSPQPTEAPHLALAKQTPPTISRRVAACFDVNRRRFSSVTMHFHPPRPQPERTNERKKTISSSSEMIE